ncbi:hypothetical protein BDQ17DRAFT_1430817 [Cyathus striatus]|nr:hypothetical protein BDQ17DRAFT_1430817 [Cyathus striatus]
MPITIPTTTTHTKPPSPSPPHTRPKIPPPINGMDKHTMFEFVDSVSLTVWSSHMHKPYFWAMIGDDAATNSNEPTHFRIEFVLDTLRSVVGNDTEFVAIPASTQVPKTVSFKAPHPILVTCDSEEVVTRLVERRYIDTPDGWLCIFPKNLHPSSFIMYLRAPVVEDSPTHKAQIIESVQTRLRTIPDFRVFVENNCTDPLLLKITSKEVRFEYIVNSVRASAIQVVSNGSPMVLWRIYMHPVTCDVKKHWGVLVKELRMLKYPGPMWIAEAITDTTVFRCNRCKALDHPAGLCPVWEYEGSWCRAQTRSGRKL